MELDPLPSWWQPGAMALLLMDLQQGTCGDAQPRPRPAFDRQFRTYTQPAAQRTLVVIGLLTDQCIDHTVKDAAGRDAGAAWGGAGLLSRLRRVAERRHLHRTPEACWL